MQVFWPKVVLKKWLNLKSKDLDLGASLAADDDDDDDGSDVDGQGTYGHGWPPRPHLLRRVSVPGSPYLTFVHSGARPEGQRQRLSPLCPLTSCCLALLRQSTAAVTTAAAAAALAGRTMTATAPRSPVRSTNSFILVQVHPGRLLRVQLNRGRRAAQREARSASPAGRRCGGLIYSKSAALDYSSPSSSLW